MDKCSKAEKQEKLHKDLMDADMEKETKKETKEHPELSKGTVKKIVEDHEKKGKHG